MLFRSLALTNLHSAHRRSRRTHLLVSLSHSPSISPRSQHLLVAVDLTLFSTSLPPIYFFSSFCSISFFFFLIFLVEIFCGLFCLVSEYFDATLMVVLSWTMLTIFDNFFMCNIMQQWLRI